MWMRLSTSILILISLFIQAPIALAQSSIIPNEAISIELRPETPRAGDDVTISLKSFATDLKRATMVWTKDGVPFLEGTGVTEATVKSPAVGKSVNVKVSIRTIEGATFSKSVVLRPGDLDLIWETSGSVPLFYRGKAHPVYQNMVTISAMPRIIDQNGVVVDPKTLIYNWKNGSKVMQNESGYGKQTVSIEGDVIARPIEVSVEVSTRDSAYKVSGSLSVEPSEPEILVYKNDPLYGILFNKAIDDNFRFSSEESSAEVVPYGFDEWDRLSYLWMINGFERQELSNKSSVVFRAREGTTGTSQISLDVRNPDKILQSKGKNFTAYYNRIKSNDDL